MPASTSAGCIISEACWVPINRKAQILTGLTTQIFATEAHMVRSACRDGAMVDLVELFSEGLFDEDGISTGGRIGMW